MAKWLGILEILPGSKQLLRKTSAENSQFSWFGFGKECKLHFTQRGDRQSTFRLLSISGLDDNLTPVVRRTTLVIYTVVLTLRRSNRSPPRTQTRWLLQPLPARDTPRSATPDASNPLLPQLSTSSAQSRGSYPAYSPACPRTCHRNR